MLRAPLAHLIALMLLLTCLSWCAAQNVSGFVFSGNTAVSQQALEQALAPFQGQPVTDQQLSQISAAVTKLYADRGYLVSVQATQQDDKVNVAITESKANVVVEDAQAYSKPFIESHFRKLTKGTWTTKDLEKAMLILRDLPGLAAAKATLRSGAQPGVTDVTINLGDAQHDTGFKFGVRADTFGSPYVSRERIAESVWRGNMTGRGDELQLQLVHGFHPSDLLYGDLRYTYPLSGDGTKLKAYFAAGDFEVGRDLAVLNLQGTTISFGASAVRPLVRTRYRSVLAEAGLDISNSDFDMALTHPSISISKDRVRKLRVGGIWDWTERSARGHNIAAVYLHQGLGGFLGGTGSEDTPSRAGATNGFTKLTIEGARQQRLSALPPDDHRPHGLTLLNVSLSTQLSPDTLMVGEQMSIGGADSVRGYPQSEHLGDSGLRASVEVRHSFPVKTTSKWLREFTALAFVDHGTVWLHNAGLSEDSSPSITGAGVGFRTTLGSAKSFYNVRFDLGFALSGTPSAGGTVQPYVRVDHAF